MCRETSGNSRSLDLTSVKGDTSGGDKVLYVRSGGKTHRPLIDSCSTRTTGSGEHSEL